METRTAPPPGVCQSAKRRPSCHRSPLVSGGCSYARKIFVPLASFIPGCTVVEIGSPFPPAALPSPPAPHPGSGGVSLFSPSVARLGPDGREHVRHGAEGLALLAKVAEVAPELQTAGFQGLLGVQFTAAEGGGHLSRLD